LYITTTTIPSKFTNYFYLFQWYILIDFGSQGKKVSDLIGLGCVSRHPARYIKISAYFEENIYLCLRANFIFSGSAIINLNLSQKICVRPITRRKSVKYPLYEDDAMTIKAQHHGNDDLRQADSWLSTLYQKFPEEPPEMN
jgi:hypothetical protein